MINWRMFIGYAFEFFDKAAGFSVDVMPVGSFRMLLQSADFMSFS